ncbi:MAG: ABC transporter permease [Acidobacteriaceae bacterium]|nr:ABC transporter permease [Acidobacteriaceae bacterium]
MITKLVIENLKHRWVRTLLSALVIGVQVMSILTILGLSRGILNDSAQRAKGTGADIFLKPDTGGTISFSTGQVREAFVDLVRKQPHVARAVGVLMIALPGGITNLSGVNIPEFQRISPGFRFLQGGPPQTPDGLIVDEYYARQNKVQIGETVKLLNHDWHVSGVIQGGVLARLIVQLRTLQALTGNADPPRVSQILVKVDDPARTDQEVAYLNQLLKGNLRAVSIQEFTSQLNINNIPSLKAFIAVITALAVVVGFLVVFLSMYTAVVERTREIGILKALGAKPGTVVGILVREALVLAILGSAIGILLSFGAKALIMNMVPASLQVVDVPDWWPIAAAIAIGGALLGATYPGMKAARQDAIEALAYE